jgi:colanic acid/amylovoran biosynthesis glycosyltransferase
MKIAFILPVFPAISQTFILNQITGLIDLGHDISIFSRSTPEATKIHNDVTKYKLIDKTCYYRTYIFKRSSNRFLRIINSMWEVFKHYPLKPRSMTKACLNFAARRERYPLGLIHQIAPFCHYEKFDIIYCHFGDLGIFGATLKELDILGGKLVTVFHGYDLSTYTGQHGSNVYSDLFEKGDLFLPISAYWKNKLLSMGCPDKKVRVHRMGIDTERFKYRIRPRKNNTIKILSVARLVEKKGIQFAIEAVSKIVEKYSNIEYSIAGDGPLSEHLNMLIQSFNLEKRVKILGWKSQDEIAVLMSEADILLAPSITGSDGDMEGIPVVLMEACAQGLPAISSFHSGIPELIQDGISGFLTKEGDVDQIAEKLRWMIDNPEKCSEMADKARAHVIENFDIKNLNIKLELMFKELVTSRHILHQ